MHLLRWQPGRDGPVTSSCSSPLPSFRYLLPSPTFIISLYSLPSLAFTATPFTPSLAYSLSSPLRGNGRLGGGGYCLLRRDLLIDMAMEVNTATSRCVVTVWWQRERDQGKRRALCYIKGFRKRKTKRGRVLCEFGFCTQCGSTFLSRVRISWGRGRPFSKREPRMKVRFLLRFGCVRFTFILGMASSSSSWELLYYCHSFVIIIIIDVSIISVIVIPVVMNIVLSGVGGVFIINVISNIAPC